MSGKLKFVKRGTAVAATITEDDLSARDYGSAITDPLSKARAQDLELPHEINVLYINPDSDYQQGTQKAERSSGNGVNAMSLPLPIVMSDAKAKQVADANLFNAWASRNTYQLQLSRKWSKLEPTDVIDVIYNDKTFRMRIVKKDTSKAGILSFECESEDFEVYSQSGTGAGVSNMPVQVVAIPVQTVMMFFDIPALRDLDNDAGFYIVADGVRAGWRGCALYQSIDGLSYTPNTSLTAAASIGYAQTALGNFYGGYIFDELNTVTVMMLNGSLSSVTEVEVLGGANVAVLGNEIIQFKNAELIATNTYRLSGLLRGLRGTEWLMGSHAIGDRFALVDINTWRRIVLATSEIGVAKSYKAVSFGMTLQQTNPQVVTATGAALECYSPVEAGAGRNSTNDVTIQWKRRNRLSGEWRNYIDVPMSEGTESYEIEIYSNATFSTIKRTLTSTTNSVTYTAAQQITDFGIEVNRVYVKIYQLSATVGRGVPLTASLELGALLRLSTRWRINVVQTYDTWAFMEVAIREIEMAESVGGATACIGGTASAQYGTGSAANAFDGNSTTGWYGGTPRPSWIEYTFPSAVNIMQLKIQAGNAGSAPSIFQLQYYNGSIWVSVLSITGEVWSSLETKTYLI